MDKNVKAFIFASLIYLVAGGLLGTLFLFQIGDAFMMKYAHMHLMLLGFMTMMVFGIGYFILPKFNGVTIKWEWMISVHFWVANVGLLGLCFADISFRPIFALIALLSLVMFALNMIMTLAGAPDSNTRNAQKIQNLASLKSAASNAQAVRTDAPQNSGSGKVLTGDENLGEVLKNYPELEEVVRIFFGDGCFSCPGQETETLRQAAQVHNIDLDMLLDEMRSKLN
jgi:hypothetical protein